MQLTTVATSAANVDRAAAALKSELARKAPSTIRVASLKRVLADAKAAHAALVDQIEM